MAVETNIPADVSGGSTATATVTEPVRQPEARKRSRTRSTLAGWAAIAAAGIAVAVLALVTIFGGDGGTSTNDGRNVGSDQHLVNMARDGEARTNSGP